jgi:hypothetical protein
LSWRTLLLSDNGLEGSISHFADSVHRLADLLHELPNPDIVLPTEQETWRMAITDPLLDHSCIRFRLC